MRAKALLSILVGAVALSGSLLRAGVAATLTEEAQNPGNAFTTDTLNPPTGLTATGGASIVLNWTATADTYAAGYRVLRGTATGGPYSQIAQVTPRTTTTYTDDPPPGTYYYVVRAFYQNWESASSNEASATVRITLVRKATGGGTTGTFSATFPATPVAGDLLIAVAATRQSGTITVPVGWSTAIDQSGPSVPAPNQVIFYKVAGSSEPTTVTVTTTASGSGNGLHLYEYRWVNTLDVVGSTTGSGTVVSSGSITTAYADELIFAGLVTQQGTNFSNASWINGFIEENDFTKGAGGAITVFGGADRVVSATGTYSTSATSNASGAWRGQIATFKNSGGYGGAHGAAYGAAPATSTPTPSATPTPTPALSATPSPTATPTPAPAVMPSPTATPAPALSTTPSPIGTPTPALSTTPSPTATPTPTLTVTPSPTATPTPTATTTPSCSAGDTGFLGPSAQAADTGGDGNGFEVDPTYAFADDSSFAVNVGGAGDQHRYYSYGASIPSGCSVKGIEVRLDWWLGSTEGANSMSVELSWDSGTSWTAAKTDTEETTSEHTATLGSSTDTWGRSWTAEGLSDANFRARVTCDSDQEGMSFNLDWVPVKVYYGP